MARPSTRSLIVGVALIGGTTAGVFVALALTSDSDRTTVVAAPPASSVTTTTPAGPAAAPSSTLGAPSTASTTVPPTLIAPSPSAAPRPENRDPQAVARNFITGYLSWHYDDKPNPQAAMRERVRPWVTDRFDAGLAQSSSAASATAKRVADHEVNTVTIASLDQIAPATTETMYLSLVTVNVTRDGAAPSKRSVYVQAKLLNVGGNWYVDELIR